jgi:hypothetical protein
MLQSRKDQDAVAAVKSAILALFEAEKIDHIEVLPAEDQAGEAALSVTVFLKAEQKRISGARLLDAIAAAATALREIEDYRFPYVTFLAPEDESAEDTRPAA